MLLKDINDDIQPFETYRWKSCIGNSVFVPNDYVVLFPLLMVFGVLFNPLIYQVGIAILILHRWYLYWLLNKYTAAILVVLFFLGVDPAILYLLPCLWYVKRNPSQVLLVVFGDLFVIYFIGYGILFHAF